MMLETPDFDAIAKQLAPPDRVELVVDALLLVWNGRGAADIAEMEWAFEGTTPSMKTLDGALRNLDR
jgi:hypothetical protein